MRAPSRQEAGDARFLERPPAWGGDAVSKGKSRCGTASAPILRTDLPRAEARRGDPEPPMRHLPFPASPRLEERGPGCDTLRMDLSRRHHHLAEMSRFARCILVALLAVLAAWSAVQAGTATTMSLDMAAAVPATDMTDCDACDSDKAGGRISPACDLVCASTVLADLSAGPGPAPAPATSLPALAPAADRDGLAPPPDPFPPRSLLPI